MNRPVLVAAALPAVMLAMVSLLMLVMALAGAHPFWHDESLTLSEAAALRDGGEIVRLVESGHDPNQSYPVRAGFLFDEATMMRPVEAAYAARRPEIAELLIDLGATPEADPRAGSDR